MGTHFGPAVQYDLHTSDAFAAPWCYAPVRRALKGEYRRDLIADASADAASLQAILRRHAGRRGSPRQHT